MPHKLKTENKHSIFFVAVVVLIIVAIVIILIFVKKNKTNNNQTINPETFKGQVIDDVVKIPTTTQIMVNEGENVVRGEYNIKLQPQSEIDKVLIVKAKLTLKEAYNTVQEVAKSWSDDAKLISIKSNGALGLDGKSSSWQLIFGSYQKEKAYEIIIEADKIIAQKEIVSDVYGYELPLNWYDSNEAISSFSNLPQFGLDTISSISFYYSFANDSWAYGLANGEKTTSMWVN
jgi:hypothetical protein